MNEEYICRCEEVTRKEIQEAIDDGATTLAGVKRRTRAGMGLCQGRTCQRLVTQMLAKVEDPAEIKPPTSRPPVRAIKIGEIAEEEDE
ncbi:BFD domain protein (2Fe-2S)-binding domain protein [Tepidanaerobacter acetatoxydans Re1]|uniref:BFD domain protein (2Fe-2S)-binding domain protein n=1 Tax=Tepidanaerobacter acetatoxydans (strain DSM 21804 / JCM 16047 / Re1) TaxID=1209989 RepID=F4LWD5_TEPAE|nr:(2Fe-2S)-binding protein [Tepidanaerobacter acetatoxydans]AEE91733.1 BFD domain protein (2Fe-2S)-binding domain protein [Tepidanaerobacter acetatoxydans Re1]CCP26501.1 BFD domain protein (2Fe-2S)-binding domain protein [Tepidanaerobacter acetatoxydans Re1]